MSESNRTWHTGATYICAPLLPKETRCARPQVHMRALTYNNIVPHSDLPSNFSAYSSVSKHVRTIRLTSLASLFPISNSYNELLSRLMSFLFPSLNLVFSRCNSSLDTKSVRYHLISPTSRPSLSGCRKLLTSYTNGVDLRPINYIFITHT